MIYLCAECSTDRQDEVLFESKIPYRQEGKFCLNVKIDINGQVGFN